MNLKSLSEAINRVAKEKGFAPEQIVDFVEHALASAYKKDYGDKGESIRAEFDPESGEAEFWKEKTVVTEDMIYSEEEIEDEEYKDDDEDEKKIFFNPKRYIMLKDAKEIDSDIEPGETLKIPLENKSKFGRIAAQTAKQVIIQRLREAEKEAILNEYKEKEGELISGTVQRKEGSNVLVNIGKTLGILTKSEQIPGEFYKPGQRLKVYLKKVEKASKGPKVFLSRSYPKLVSKLFELEVPEISEGLVEIKSIAREPGSRTKIAVQSTEENIDPIGAAVGQRGTRVQVIINELGGEKIDIVEYSENPKEYISNALSPAEVLEIHILPKNKALVIVPEDELSLAIGKNGQNVRLAAKLTGWKIDVRKPGDEKIEEMLEKAGEAEETEENETEENETEENDEDKDNKKENDKE